MKEDKFGLGAIMRLHEQLKAFEGGPAVDAIRDAQRMADQLSGGPAVDAIRDAQRMADQLSGGPAVDAIRDAQRIADQLSGGPAVESIRRAQRMADQLSGGSAARTVAGLYMDVLKQLREMQERPEQKLLRTIAGVTRRLALMGVAASAGGAGTDILRSSRFVTEQVALLGEIADKAADTEDLEEVGASLVEVVSAARSFTAEDRSREELRQRVQRLEAELSALRTTITGPNRQDAMGMLALFVAFFSLFLAFVKPSWVFDLEARQRRLLHDHDEILGSQRGAAVERRQLKEQIAELANRLGVYTLRTRARLHARRTGASVVLRSLEAGEAVTVLLIRGRWALVEAKADEKVGWIRKKAVALP